MRRKRSERRAAKRQTQAPPLRGGINASPVVLPSVNNLGEPVKYRTLGEWAEAGWGGAALAAFARGDYLGDGNQRLSASDPYTVGKRIWVFRPVLDEPQEPIELTVVAENERYLVIEKPHGMASIPRGSHVANTVTVAARRQFANDHLVVAHRLDLETAGLVLLTKAPQYRAKYQTVFQRREIQKTYLAAAPILEHLNDGITQSLELPLWRPEGQIWVEVFDENSERCKAFVAAGGKPWLSRTEIRLVREVSRPRIAGLEGAEELAGFEQEFGGLKGLEEDASSDKAGRHDVEPFEISHHDIVTGRRGVGTGRREGGAGSADVGRGRNDVGTGRREVSTASADVEINRTEQYDFSADKCDFQRVSTTVGDFWKHSDARGLPEKWGIYELRPHSGYLHQLRVTMLHLGAPIFGDPLYPVWFTKEQEAERGFWLQLLARELKFVDPQSGEDLHFVSQQRLALDL